MLKIIQIIIATVLTLNMLPLQADLSLSEKIKIELRDDLYPVTSLLPGYHRPINTQPKFAVAEFRLNNDKDYFFSRILADFLRTRIQFVPNSPLYMPALFNTHIDSGLLETLDRPLLTTSESFSNLHHALGIGSILTGTLQSNEGYIELGAELVNAEKGAIIKKRDWVFPIAAPSTALVEISRWVYDSLDVDLNPEQLKYLEDLSSLPDGAFNEFVLQYPEIYKAQGPLKRDKAQGLFERYPKFALAAIYTLQTRLNAKDLEQAYKNLELYEKFETQFSDHSGVVLQSYMATEIEMLPKHKLTRRLDKIKHWVSKNYQDPTVVVSYADMLVNNGNTLDAIALLAEGVEVWPEQYRLWWSLGWALNSHAWQVRGDTYWKDVPEKAKESYRILSELSDWAVDEALKLNPLNVKLWNMKLNALGSRDGFSDELIEMFDQAVVIDPSYRRLYDSAMNFSLSRWGGNAMARKHIIELAEKNNPEAPWVDRMKRTHAAELESWDDQLGNSPVENLIKELIGHPYAKWMAIIFGGGILLLVFYIGRKSAFDEICEFDDSEAQETSVDENRNSNKTVRK